ncbi:hypothetical protein PIROE2DRAFT_12400 [Piromyces sp. E2]|nr:hypothetical protein PIROE2DRAFT_12400 [Piromyces sp. E2]|eukprot:OUM61576.1 hypothetical protein PIROE2DRAFT_12400 [Piromyces sp. E2]
MDHPTAVKEFNRLKEIGTVSEDGQSITITKEQLNQYAKSHLGETIGFPSEIANYFIDMGLKKAGIDGPFTKVIMNTITLGNDVKLSVSREAYVNALEEGGPVAAALTNPLDDGCSIQ